MSNTLELAKSLISKPSITPDDHGCQAIMIDRLKKLALKYTHLNLEMLIISGQFMEIVGLYLPLRGIRMLSLQVMKMPGILSHLSRR